MNVLRRGRRQFLIGAGGFTLALPILTSLLPREARAQVTPRQKRFVGFVTGHGAIWTEHMFPGDGMLTERMSLFSDHEIKRGTLTLGGDGSLSPVLAGSRLSATMATKLNVIRGLDLPYYIAHNTGMLGNFGRSDNEFTPSGWAVPYTPTIDQVMASSSSFYPTSSYLVPSLHVGGGVSEISWERTGSGSVDPVRRTHDSAALFDSIFVSTSTTPPPDPRMPVVDRVLEHYRRLQSGAFGDARRLSSQDRHRLDDHMQRLAEIQASIVRRGMTASCGDVAHPSGSVGGPPNDASYDSTRNYHSIMNDIIAAAFICGTSSVATVQAYEQWSDFSGDWHQDVAHHADGDASKQGIITDAARGFFNDGFLDLAAKLDVEEADGRTYLDNSLLMWTQESGCSTHDPISLPIVTAGGAGGFLRTGNYVDYTNRGSSALMRNGGVILPAMHPGILYTQWLGTVLQAMGLPPSEYERDGNRGYIGGYRDTYYQGHAEAWPDRLFSMGGVVPFLGA